MKLGLVPHRWKLEPRAAVALQLRLARAVVEETCGYDSRLVCGVDAAFPAGGDLCVAAAVVWDAWTGSAIEQQVAVRPTQFPYVPGLLSFREAPAILAALRKLKTTPHVLICDGQGRAHPRRFGIACHVGIIAGLPTIGCAKTRLIGSHPPVGERRGDRSPLCVGTEEVGAVVCAKGHSKPLFVSIGHRILLHEAVEIVLACTRGHRLPEPTRLADRLVGRERQRLNGQAGRPAGSKPSPGSGRRARSPRCVRPGQWSSAGVASA